jgi:transaldolase/glucose-6-phosphate isomerase
MNPLIKLNSIGQSVWYDNIQRKLIRTGELAKLVKNGEIRGVTSNPSIFNAAITKSKDYDATVQPLAWAGWNADAIFWQIAIEDIQAAAKIFMDVYEQSNKGDGYVSLEVNPLFAYDTEKTITDAKALWKRVSLPNLMIKIPATKEGVKAIRAAIVEGININATLIFSLDRYAQVLDAYMGGLEDRINAGKSIENISSVASFFVSRVDTKIDGFLQRMINAGEISEIDGTRLQGKAAIANAKLAYQLFTDSNNSARFKALMEKGGRPQRPLWASTSTKNPTYRDVLYVEELIGKDSVNTIPPATMDAFRDHGKVEIRIDDDLGEAESLVNELSEIGIEMELITTQLEMEGVQSFTDAYKELIVNIQTRAQEYQIGIRSLEKLYQASMNRMVARNIIESLYEGDPTPWTNDPNGQEEFKNRLGWLNAPQKSLPNLKKYSKLREELLKMGFKKALVIGMGGSSLAPEVFSLISSKVDQKEVTGLKLGILDSTDPLAVQRVTYEYPVDSTIFIVSSKSGSTVEIIANFKYFWNLVETSFGDKTGSRFIAITDPATELDKLAREKEFLHIFHADPEVGGRFSALTAFGLIPAALVGLDTGKLIKKAISMYEACLPTNPMESNPGVSLGTMIGTAAGAGRDKLTIIADPEVESIGSWLEQLIAESTGKKGKGILPVDQEPEINAGKYGNDRLFVYLRLNGKQDIRFTDLISIGHVGFAINLEDIYDLGAEIYRWEIATSIACAVLEINPFDQPDVQASKSITQKMIQDYKKVGTLEEEPPNWQSFGIDIYGNDTIIRGKSLKEIVADYLAQAKRGNYIAVNAYFPREEKIITSLQILRKKIIDNTGLATTLGFGPRFLHSTGQFHKGGPNSGLFIILTHKNEKDISVPGEPYSFGVLEKAQAIGDYQALKERGRRVIRINIPPEQIQDLL